MEHQIRDKQDVVHPVDYIHSNPVSHGLVAAPKDGCYSSFHRYGREGIYPEDWGADGQVMLDSGVGREELVLVYPAGSKLRSSTQPTARTIVLRGRRSH